MLTSPAQSVPKPLLARFPVGELLGGFRRQGRGEAGRASPSHAKQRVGTKIQTKEETKEAGAATTMNRYVTLPVG